MIKERLNKLKEKLNLLDLDGYVIPKNDDFFSEYSIKDRLKIISNFSGSAGYAVILKDKNFLFVDGRYSLQAQIESGKLFKIKSFQEIFNCTLFKNLTLGIDPKMFTSGQIHNFFSKNKDKFDVIYIDGYHKGSQVYKDFKNSWKVLNENGVIIFDDYIWNFYRNLKDNPCYMINLHLKEIKNKVKILKVSNSQLFIKKIC